jgi:tetratricopeptide (TPR) repeat protein
MVGLLEHSGRFDEALRLLDQVSQRYPTDPVAPELKGEVLLAQGGRLPQAEAAYRLAVTRAPRWWPPYRDLVRLDLGRADRDAAAAVLHEAADRALLAERDRIELAGLFSRTGQEEDAIKQYDEVLKRNPKSTAAAAGLALLLVSYRTDGASLSRAASLVRPLANSSDWQLLDAFGWVEFKNADLTTALAALGKAAAQRPDIAELRFHLGMAELKSGNAASAEKDLAAAVSHDVPFFGRDEAKAVLAELRSRKS